MCASKTDLELYIHIPFCIKKCNYCDFLSFPSNEERREIYVQSLINEIEQTGKLLDKDSICSAEYLYRRRYTVASFRKADREDYAGGTECIFYNGRSRNYNGDESGNAYEGECFFL